MIARILNAFADFMDHKISTEVLTIKIQDIIIPLENRISQLEVENSNLKKELQKLKGDNYSI